MPTRIHSSNHLDELIEPLCEILSDTSDDPFASTSVVVHSQGLARHLTMRIAHRMSICANVDFVHPELLAGRLLQTVLGPDADLGARTGDALTWALLAALEDPAVWQACEMAPIRRYLRDATDRERLALLSRVGALFERYAIYRPELVRAWRDGTDPSWEAVLWRAVGKRLPGDDPGALVDAYEAALADAADLPRRLAVFSVGTIAPLTLRIVTATSSRLPVDFFVLTPSRCFATPTTPRHPLLASCGTLARDLGTLLSELAPDAARLDHSREQTARTALAVLQNDLLLDRTPPPTPLPSVPALEFHACHGPLRQLHALRDILLRLLEDQPDLQLRDILVMTPSIQTWAPLIDAVFDDGSERWADHATHPSGMPRLRYRLADRGVRLENPVAEALLSFLSLASGRLTASEVLDLLAIEPVRQRFGIEADDVPTLREWSIEAGARWGADADHRGTFDQPPTEGFTWRYALDRLLLGSALTATDRVVLDAVPCGENEGGDERALLARFADFVETVLEEVPRLAVNQGAAEWRDHLLRLLEGLVSSASGWQLRQVQQGLRDIAAAADAAACTRSLDLQGFQSQLEGRFTAQQPGQGYLSGAVTFSELVPMRSVPFEVVVLLGMDEGEFPRGTSRLAFDRMASDIRTGDRSPTADDRALFLEAIQSAQRHLVVLYTGYNARNQEVPPCVPVGELLDVLDIRFTIPEPDTTVRSALTTRHPLQPYSPLPFEGIPTSHDRRMQRAASELVRGSQQLEASPFPLTRPAPEPSVAPTRLSLDHLVAFWKAPAERFLRRRLGLWIRDEATALSDREPIEAPRGLDSWKLKTTLLERRMAGHDLALGSETWNVLRRSWELPLGENGRQIYLDHVDAVETVFDEAAPYLSDARTALGLDLPIGGLRLTGRLGGLVSAGRVEVSMSKLKPKGVLATWIRHLAWHATGGSGVTRLFAADRAMRFLPLEQEDAAELLEELVSLREEGLKVPLLFFPSTSCAFAKAIRSGRAQPKRWLDFEPGDRVRDLVRAFPFAKRPPDLSPLPVPPGLDAKTLAIRIWHPIFPHCAGGAE